MLPFPLLTAAEISKVALEESSSVSRTTMSSVVGMKSSSLLIMIGSVFVSIRFGLRSERIKRRRAAMRVVFSARVTIAAAQATNKQIFVYRTFSLSWGLYPLSAQKPVQQTFNKEHAETSETFSLRTSQDPPTLRQLRAL